MRLFAILALSIAAVSMTFAQSSSKQVFPGANPAMPFSAAVKADGLIYVSGTLGSGGDVKAQTKQVLDNISATLKTAGSSLANAASVTVYLRNQADFAAMNEVYRGYWTKDPPARTTVMVPLLNEGLVEIAVVAVPDGGERVVVNPSEWSSSPNPYSYGDQDRQHAVHVGADRAQRQGQHADQGRHDDADQGGARQRRGGAQGRRLQLQRRRRLAHLHLRSGGVRRT